MWAKASSGRDVVFEKMFKWYIIWGLALFVFGFRIFRNHILEGFERDVFLGFFVLFVISIIGTAQNFNLHAFVCVIGVVCIGSFFIDCAFIPSENQKGYFEFFYIILLGRLLLRTFRGDYLGNSLPAFLLFCTLIYSALLLDKSEKNITDKHRILTRIYNVMLISMALGLMIFVGCNASSRTPIFTAVLIIICFLAFRFFRFRESTYKKLFWILVVILVVGIYIYINVSTYDWFNTLNKYSVLFFHKRIDSQRPDIWRFSLESLELWQFFVGNGTGVLPTYSGYESSSFHNTYLQLLMQNGVIGVAILIHIFKLVWYKLAENCNDVVCQFIISGFIGIMIFNVFECTLLQNKAFVGLTEWMFLCVGIIRIRSISGERNN